MCGETTCLVVSRDLRISLTLILAGCLMQLAIVSWLATHYVKGHNEYGKLAGDSQWLKLSATHKQSSTG